MPINIVYPVDLTGVNANNLVTNEIVDLTALTARLIVPAHGSFFEQSIVIRDFYTNQPLVRDTDYVVAQLDTAATVEAGGKACYQLIIIKNESVNRITLQYQAVGGPYSLSIAAIQEFITLLENDNGPIFWGMILGLPEDGFPAAPHLTDMNDTYGYKDVIFALNRIADKIAQGDAAAFETVYSYIDSQHSIAMNNKANSLDVAQGINDTKFMTPFGTAEMIRAGVQPEPYEILFSDYLRYTSGDIVCVDDSLKLVYEDGIYKIRKGVAFVNGQLVTLSADATQFETGNNSIVNLTSLISTGNLIDVFLDCTFVKAQNRMFLSPARTQMESISANYIYSGSVYNPSYWEIASPQFSGILTNEQALTYIKPQADYGYDGLRTINKIMPLNGKLLRIKAHTAVMNVANTYTLSFYAKGIAGNRLAVKFGDTNVRHKITLTGELTRYSVVVPWVNGSHAYIETLNNSEFFIGDFQITSKPVPYGLMYYGNAITHNSWIKQGVTVSTSADIHPWDASADFFSVRETTASSTHGLVQPGITLTAGQLYRIRFVLKNKGRDHIKVILSGNGWGTSSVIDLAEPSSNNVTHAGVSAKMFERFEVSWLDLQQSRIEGYKEVIIEVCTNDPLGASGALLIQSQQNALTDVFTGDITKGFDISGVEIVALHGPNKNILPPVNEWSKGGPKSTLLNLTTTALELDTPSDQGYTYKLKPTWVSGEHAISGSIPWVPGQPLVVSAKVYSGGYSRVKLEVNDGVGSSVSFRVDIDNTGYPQFRLITGTALTNVNCIFTNNVLSVRVSPVDGTANKTLNFKLSILTDNDSESFSGDYIKGVYLDYIQAEYGLSPTAYVNNPEATSPALCRNGGSVANYSYHGLRSSTTKQASGNIVTRLHLGTIKQSGLADAIIDRRPTMPDGADRYYSIEDAAGVALKPNRRYWLLPNEQVILPSTRFLRRGDSFDFDKTITSTTTIAVEDTTRDVILARNYDTDSVEIATEFTYDSDRPVTIIFNGSDYEIRY